MPPTKVVTLNFGTLVPVEVMKPLLWFCTPVANRAAVVKAGDIVPGPFEVKVIRLCADRVDGLRECKVFTVLVEEGNIIVEVAPLLITDGVVLLCVSATSVRVGAAIVGKAVAGSVMVTSIWGGYVSVDVLGPRYRALPKEIVWGNQSLPLGRVI